MRKLTFNNCITKKVWSSLFALILELILQKIITWNVRAFQTKHVAQLLVQALVNSRQDYCITLLTSAMCNQTSTHNSKYRSENKVKDLPALATGFSLYQVQDIDGCLQNISSRKESLKACWKMSITSLNHHKESQNHLPEPLHSLFLAGS